MDTSKRTWVATVVVATVVCGPAMPVEAKHTPISCGIHYHGPDDPPRIQSLDELPVGLQTFVTQHVTDRVGAELAASTIFDRGQLLKPERPLRPGEPTQTLDYNLIYRYRLSSAEDVSACLIVSADGWIIQELSLPAWGHAAPPPKVVTREQATSVAREHGMSEDLRDVEVRYFADTDALEWLFSKTTYQHGPTLSGKTLHVPVQESAGCHWSQWSAIR